MEVFSVKNKNKKVEKITEQKKKDIIQIDTGSEVTLIPRNFGKRIGKPTLRKSSLLLHQFDGSIEKI